MRQRRMITATATIMAAALAAASCGSDEKGSVDTVGTATESAAPVTVVNDEPAAPVTAPDAVITSVVEETEEPVFGGTLRVGLEAEATGLRPWEDACAQGCVNISRAIFDPLVVQNGNGEYEGYLAESITPDDDFTVWTMTLRPDVLFHNGVALTASSIADMFALQRDGAISSGLIATSGLASVEAVDDLTVVYTLADANSAFPSNLYDGPLGYVFEPGAAAADPAGFSKNPVGTGPFVLTSRDIDNETIVERNDNYWRTDASGDRLPYLDRVVFHPIPDEGTRLDAVISGTVDVIQAIRQGTIRDARLQPGLDMYEFQGNSTGGGMYNTAVPPFDDVRVRRGLNHLNDPERVIESLGGAGISLPSTQWFSADSPWWTQEAADAYLEFDFDAAKALLQEYIDDPTRSDGKAPGDKIDVELTCMPDPTLVASMQVREQVWSGTGLINVTLVQEDQAAHIRSAIDDTHRASCWRWSGQGDPSVTLNPFLADPAASVVNFSNWWDPEAYEWALEAIRTDDFETRKELYSKINVRINEQAPVWYSGGEATAIISRPSVRGINSWTTPSGNLGDGTPEAVTFFTSVFVSSE